MSLALVSVSDKTGLKEFAERLKKAGFEFLASGGTAKFLRSINIKVTEVSEYTSFPEILGGRVKTLHPVIHGGILARNTEEDLNSLKELKIEAIDMVIANLYPFEKTIADFSSTETDCIENIDIGGVTLLRAAAKNYGRVSVICDFNDYDEIAGEIEKTGSVSIKERKLLALKAFDVCTRYDAAIGLWLKNKIAEDSCMNSEVNSLDKYKALEGRCAYIAGFEGQSLRYGENPHQRAWLYNTSVKGGVLGGTVLQGKELSYNNILDVDAAWRAVSVFLNPAAVVVKHLTPCGIAEAGGEGNGLHIALEAAVACDSVSAYGSIIAVNRIFDKNCFDVIEKLFAECIIAPVFSEDVKPLLALKKNLRIIEAPALSLSEKYEYKSILNGFLLQEKDFGDSENTEYKNAAKRKASANEEKLLRFAMKACIAVKSNAVLLAAPIDGSCPENGICTVGIGCGQPNRVDAAKQAIERAGEKAENSVLASDAFFPFADTIKIAAEAGISAVVQPGGSIRDELSIAECDKNGMAMLVTGVRHFKH
ncbi:bifunctional phosphoribosylaminoimidazolecarboxamide formyltransferase/IMP cyclohydrolase [Treponema pedis]|uniref:bifunctional phosphoribosylaminoimidazolecarboxamide formyltransferase/IMP cyclohydrolase n=1 Tax=Treponema pedis TaxID=409322 RepID=UPI0019803872|nr:bifunctional phosphoribosylaminoimidazolecarboxamide formyltransferase/IMP cyclohydrolase [Treponema pedis]QSI04991.1 bifunctional phosphoribosylaminoimidazolecarboxamide formyltransferase/IMP cyclohydrolase PurH [Treponema pedis]